MVAAISISALLMTGAFSANAQETPAPATAPAPAPAAAATVDAVDTHAEVGFRYMPTFTSFNMQTSTGGEVSGSVILGNGVGMFLGFNFTDNVGVQGEVIYTSISQKYVDDNIERRVNLKYVNIPILLSLNTGKSNMVNFNISAGPQIGFNVGSSMSISSSNDTITMVPILVVRKNDLGFAYGAGLDFALNPMRTIRLGFGYRGVIGLLDVSGTSKSITTDSYYLLERTRIRTNAGYIGLSFMF